jgi:SulP family sulfate permease
VILLMWAGARVGPRVPVPFIALALAGGLAWWLERTGHSDLLPLIEPIPPGLPRSLTPWYTGGYETDVLVGAAAISLVGIIQTLAIAKSLSQGDRSPYSPKRDLIAVGVANLAAGLAHGLPGSGSFARSALVQRAGARTRLAGLVCAGALLLLVLYAGPLAQHIPRAAIAGLLMATACSIVDWSELAFLLRHERDERIVLAATMLGVLFLPVHWAILIGLALSGALFIRRAARLHLTELIGGPSGPFIERRIDGASGLSVITLLQVEGPLFFAHADEISGVLRRVLERGPRVVIVRMRRTQQIDFSVIAALSAVVRDYQAAGGAFIICGLTRAMRSILGASPLGKVVTPRRLLRTRPGEVFGSAQRAIRMALEIAAGSPADRPLFRGVAGRGERPSASGAQSPVT